jgi:hypothetical protein
MPPSYLAQKIPYGAHVIILFTLAFAVFILTSVASPPLNPSFLGLLLMVQDSDHLFIAFHLEHQLPAAA